MDFERPTENETKTVIWSGILVISPRSLADLYTESGQTLRGSFSAVLKPNLASKYSYQSSRRDLHEAFLCTVLESTITILVGSVWVKKYTKINIEKMKRGKS